MSQLVKEDKAFVEAFGYVATKPGFVFRPYQVEGTDKFDEELQKDGSRPLMVWPVSAGKSVGLARIIKKARKRGLRKIIVLTMSEKLCKQDLEALKKVAPEINAGLYCGRTKSDASIIFATAQTLGRKEHIHKVDEADLVLIDECDQAFAGAEAKLYPGILEHAKKYGGVTGTPFRLRNGGTEPIFGESEDGSPRPFDPPCHTVTKSELRDAGYFVFVKPVSLPPDHAFDLSRLKVNASGDFDVSRQLDKKRKIIASDIARLYKSGQTKAPGLGFASTQAEAQKLAEATSEAGIPSAAMVGEFDPVLDERWRRGEIKVLWSVGLLGRGYDFPEIGLLIFAFATTSRPRFEQACGRGQRPWPGKETCLLLDYGSHGLRFGGANLEWQAALIFDRKAKAKAIAAREAVKVAASHGRSASDLDLVPCGFREVFDELVEIYAMGLTETRAIFVTSKGAFTWKIDKTKWGFRKPVQRLTDDIYEVFEGEALAGDEEYLDYYIKPDHIAHALNLLKEEIAALWSEVKARVARVVVIDRKLEPVILDITLRDEEYVIDYRKPANEDDVKRLVDRAIKWGDLARA